MKTLELLNKEEEDIIKASKYLDSVTEKRTLNKNIKELTFIRMVKNYLHTNPDEDAIRAELKKLQDTKAGIEVRFNEWMESTPGAKRMKNPKTEFMKKTGISKVEDSIKTLTYILS